MPTKSSQNNNIDDGDQVKEIDSKFAKGENQQWLRLQTLSSDGRRAGILEIKVPVQESAFWILLMSVVVVTSRLSPWILYFPISTKNSTKHMKKPFRKFNTKRKWEYTCKRSNVTPILVFLSEEKCYKQTKYSSELLYMVLQHKLFSLFIVNRYPYCKFNNYIAL